MSKADKFSTNKDANTDNKVQRMQTLVKVIQELSLARDIKKIQEIVVVTARMLTGAEGATFVLREGNFCHYVNEQAIAPLWKGKRFPMSVCVSGWVMQNHQPVVIEDIYKDERVPIDAYRPTFVKSLAIVPIRTMSPVGAIGNYWSFVHKPTKEDLELLQALADTTAVALENVKVYNELEERVNKRTEELQVANEAIRRLSIRDELTGLYNRRGFYLLAEQELKRAQRQNSMPLLMFMDIDGLKDINDQLGHQVGDLLIAEAAKVLRASMRESDIIGRLGGR
jgi:GAF domain-containing protein